MEVLRSRSPAISHRGSPSPRRSESPIARSLVSPSSHQSLSPASSVGSLVKHEKKSALDIANILGTNSSGGHQPSKISPSHTIKTLDFALASRLSNGQYRSFYPYQALTHSTSNGAYPDSSTSAITNSSYGAYPLYGFPLQETASLSSLRLSALLASRRRRAAQSSSSDSEVGSTDPNEPSRKKVKPVPDDKKDNAYWERRRKNNDAAKRSRDARRAKEEEIALRAVVLEQENMKLRAEVSILKSELARLHYMVYNC